MSNLYPVPADNGYFMFNFYRVVITILSSIGVGAITGALGDNLILGLIIAVGLFAPISAWMSNLERKVRASNNAKRNGV